MGIFQWSISLLALHHIKLFIEKSEGEKIHNTIKVFFLLNFLVSIFYLSLLIFCPSLLRFWGHGSGLSFSSPSAGDAILGISFDSSIVNATINCIGLIYFLYKKEYLFSVLCILIIALCTSNVAFIIIATTLVLMFLTVRQKKLRLVVFVNGVMLLFAYFFISPANREYIHNYFVQMYVVNKSPELITQNKPDSPQLNDSIPSKLQSNNRKLSDSDYAFSKKKLDKALNHLVTVRSKNDSTGIPQLQLGDVDYQSRPGKLVSFLQTYNYLRSGKADFLFGAGVGNFSSKLAFRAAGVTTLGTYPQRFRYVSPVFEKNHLQTFLFYLRSDVSQHSVLNYPNSVYNQLLGEYGFLGAILFAVFYLGYFLKRYRALSYGRYLIFILLAFFLMEYWFETYSIIIIVELMMLLNIKENEGLPKSINSSSKLARVT
jgi:hypothetical protein